MSKPEPFATSIAFTPYDNHRLATLCGDCDKHIEQVAHHFKAQISYRGNQFQIQAEQENTVTQIIATLNRLYEITASETLSSETVFLTCKEHEKENVYPMKKQTNHNTIITPRLHIQPRSSNQADYIHNLRQHDINFAVGPAGTGKTYLAVAHAVACLEQSQVQRLIFVRPAVAAGEQLGFLPGDMEEKVLPYLRPLYDALYDTVGDEMVQKWMDRDVVEIAPLAFMRGRTLNDAFVILDEAQNTTVEQMKMFLTRLGFGAKMVITGDLTQVDLDKGVHSGLDHALKLLKHIDGCCFNFFDGQDCVRHPLVKAIINAYEHESAN